MSPLSKLGFAVVRAGRTFRRTGFGGVYRGVWNGVAGLLFDLYHGVDTDALWTRYSLPEGYEGAWGYGPAKMLDLKQVLRCLGEIRPEQFIFFDVGSGKGRTLLVVSSLPFRKLIGIEISPELHALGVANLAKFRGGTRKCLDIVTHCADSTIFPLPADNTVFFLYNPFKPPVMERFLAHLRASLLEHPREVYILYLKPLYHDMLANTGWLTPLEKSNQLAVYRYVECEAVGSAKGIRTPI